MAKRTAKEYPPVPVPIPEGDPHLEPPADDWEMEDNERKLAQFRFLFWTYLHWEVRNYLMVEMERMPDPGRELSQGTEMGMIQLIDNSREMRRLWDLMMPFLPPARRGKNPFPKNISTIDFRFIQQVKMERDPQKLTIRDGNGKEHEFDPVADVGSFQKALKKLNQNGWKVSA